MYSLTEYEVMFIYSLLTNTNYLNAMLFYNYYYYYHFII